MTNKVKPHGENCGCPLTEEKSPALGCPNPAVKLRIGINRIEIIDRTKQADEGGGRVYTNYDVKDAWVSYQDGGASIKVFINESDNG